MTVIAKQNLRKTFILSFIVGILFMIITPFIDNHFTANLFASGFYIGFVSLFMILMFEYFLSSVYLRRINASSQILLNSIAYLFILTANIIAATNIFKLSTGNDFSFTEVFFRTDFQMGLAISFLCILMIQFLLMINTLLGKHVLWNIMTAKYHRPREVSKIVMFIDITSSTMIAEKIGHLKFLSLLNDFFYDLSEAVLITKGEIYKYVGDEAIIIWDVKKGVRQHNCINMFFELQEKLIRNKANYLKKYGYFPGFKAGLHMGQVVVGEVGSIKKEIAYIGDVLNTTARIESFCSEADEPFVVSKNIIDILLLPNHFLLKSLGKPKLRGKENEIELYAIRKAENAEQ